jgi:hypothetical protein
MAEKHIHKYHTTARSLLDDCPELEPRQKNLAKLLYPLQLRSALEVVEFRFDLPKLALYAARAPPGPKALIGGQCKLHMVCKAYQARWLWILQSTMVFQRLLLPKQLQREPPKLRHDNACRGWTVDTDQRFQERYMY